MAHNEAFVKKLVDILVEQRAISRDRAAELQKAFGDTSIEEFDDFLLEEGLIEKDQLLKALSAYYEVPSFDVTGVFFKTHALREFPKDFLLRNAIIPLVEAQEQDAFDVDNQTLLMMVAAEPLRPGLESAIRSFVSYDIAFYVGLRRDICDAVKEYYDKAITEVIQDADIHQEERTEREAREGNVNTAVEVEEINEGKAEEEAAQAGYNSSFDDEQMS